MIGADFPGQDGQRPTECDQASVMQHQCITTNDYLIWYLKTKILNIYLSCPWQIVMIFRESSIVAVVRTFDPIQSVLLNKKKKSKQLDLANAFKYVKSETA